jgi:hypothetical protein
MPGIAASIGASEGGRDGILDPASSTPAEVASQWVSGLAHNLNSVMRDPLPVLTNCGQLNSAMPCQAPRPDAPSTLQHVRVRGRERRVIFAQYKHCRGCGDATSEARLFGGFI